MSNLNKSGIKQPAYPVYEECKQKLLAFMKPLDMDDGIRNALLRRASILANGVSEILTILSAEQNKNWQSLTIAEACVKYRKQSQIRRTAGAFLEMGLDSLFRAIFADFKNGWALTKTPVELSLEFAAYVPKLKEEKRKNKVESD